MFEKILICLDGSETAEQILPYISAESDCFGKVIILKVVDTSAVNLPLGVPGQSGVPIHTQAMSKRFQEELSEMPAYLEKMAQPLRDKGLEVEGVILQGIPSQAIVAYANDNDVVLIAIATHGHSGLRQVAMGSTAEYVMKHCGLPVLLVTPKK
ncbi:universal stress protein [Chloroflexota bacterium]